MTSLWRHLWPNYDTLDFKILTQCVKMLGERVLQVWRWYLQWFRRYRKKTRGGARNSPPPSGARVNDHIAWCGALGCRRIAIIFEGEGPVSGREGWHRVGGGQTHWANAVMVVGNRAGATGFRLEGQLVQKKGPWRKGPFFKWAYFYTIWCN